MDGAVATAAECVAAAAAVQATLHSQRQLRKHAPLVARDALAVLTALRPAAMLDYAVLDAATLRAVGSALRTAAPEAAASLFTADHDGCGYLIRADLLPWPRSPDGPQGIAVGSQPLLHAEDQRPAACFIAFDGSPVAPRRATHEETEDVIRQLDCVATAFEAAKLADHDAPHVDLASLPAGAPFLPTLNGWLLGYPAVYLATEDNVNAAATALSADDRLLVQLHVPALVPCADRASAHPLMAFTVPASMYSWEGLASWRARKDMALQHAPLGVWGDLTLTTTHQKGGSIGVRL